MSTPTPRADAAWAASFSPETPGFNMRDLARTLERELADQAARFHDELARRQETVRANNKLNKKELDQLRAERDAARAEVATEKNLHAQTRTVVEELNTICTDLRNAGGPPFIRSEAIRLLREDQATLRAEVERLTAQRENLLKPMRDQAIARAERAEAEVARLKADGAASAFVDMSCRASHAEAELATERARLDWLEQRGPWESWNVPCGEAEITLREPIRAAIDAAMQEDTK